jgi:hypothetical protein
MLLKITPLTKQRKLLTHYGKIRGTNITQIIEYYVNGKAIDDMSDISNDD